MKIIIAAAKTLRSGRLGSESQLASRSLTRLHKAAA